MNHDDFEEGVPFWDRYRDDFGPIVAVVVLAFVVAIVVAAALTVIVVTTV